MNLQKGLYFAVFSCWTAWLAPGGLFAGETAARIGFNEKIRPILTKHCTECHGGVKQASDVSFIYPEQVLPPDGWVIEPGNPDESSLVERITSDDDEIRMPPADHGPPLSKNEIELLREWIRQGAEWEQPWSFVRPQRQPAPPVKDEAWCLSPIDRFIAARHVAEKISPNPDASPSLWLRRVTLDLIGLPPTLAERAAFLQDVSQRGEAAYAAVVDHLLASPQYGEKWASVWLDQIRYADSRGLGFDNRRNIWKYRDWVIDAFNRDMPYDQFTVKQIAGDLLPETTMDDLVASACQRLTQANDEGGTDDEEFRVEAVLDRINTVSQAWMGMTFGCARCHDHPYEPVRHDEYFQLAAYFNNTQDSDMNEEYPLLRVPLDPAHYDRVNQLDRQISKVKRALWETEYSLASDEGSWHSLQEISAKTNNETQVAVEKKDDHAEYHTVGTVVSKTDFTIEAPLDDWAGPLTAIRITCMPLDPETAFKDSEWGFVLSSVEAKLIAGDDARPIKLAYVIADECDPLLNPQESLNPKSVDGFAAYSRINQPRSAAFVLAEPVNVTPGSNLQIILRHRKQVGASFSMIACRGHFAVSSNPAFTDLLHDSNRARQLARLARWEKERRAIESTTVPIMRERPDHLRRPTHTFIRGFYLTKDKEVFPNVPASLPPLPPGAAPNRLSFANWIVSPQNPFTARVAVNRFWARIFGAGLVITEEDFGSTGEPPSHPALLDDLAVRFQSEMQWSVKKLLRELVLSRTYRQDAKRRPELLKRDPANRLLAQGPRLRLSAEVVRDQALAISGLLSTKQFGPPVYPPIPKGVWKPFQGGDKWNTPPVGDPDRYRRTIYTYMKRTIPYPVAAAFDAPSRETCASRRLPSNTPIQAFMTLNDQTFVECSEALAKRMMESGDSLRTQLNHGFLLATCRTASEAELDDLASFVEQLPEKHDELSRLTLAASVLLNLDEVITK